MKRILLICNYFAPENEIASIRLTKFAKYLTRKDYRVEVLVEKKNLSFEDKILSNDSKGIPVHYVENSMWMRKINKIYEIVTSNYRERRYNNISDRMVYNEKTKTYDIIPFEVAYPILGSMDLFMAFLRQYDLFISAKVFLRKSKNDFDVCFSSYGNFFGHLAGKFLKNTNPCMLWIADFRDHVYQLKFTPKYVAFFTRQYENIIYRKCDFITVISRGMKRIIPEIYRKKAYHITNGFDREDRAYFRPNTEYEKLFTFCYTGRMYGGLRNISVIFSVISELIDENYIDYSTIQFIYAGTGAEIFLKQAKMCGVEKICKNYGNIPRQEALYLQNLSTFLVVSSWEDKRQPLGIITGKVLEYMSAEKPIITIINGDLEKNELAEMMRKAKLGCVYEEVYDQRDRKKLKSYIKRQYCLFKHGRKAHFAPRASELEKFDYRYLTDQLIDVIESR